MFRQTRRVSYSKGAFKKFLVFLAAFAFLFLLPAALVEKVRNSLITLLTTKTKSRHKAIDSISRELHLEVENHTLKSEISKLRLALANTAFVEKAGQEKAVLASVIYRDPMSWSSSIWINVGERTNKELGFEIVAKNSPVLSGKSVVGAIDYVAENQSRVRLITDSGLNPSVRALRGRIQNQVLIEHIEALIGGINSRLEQIFAKEQSVTFLKNLCFLKEKLLEEQKDCYLAKGILKGSGAPLWRSPYQLLKGIGFNYDFADEYGPSCNLASQMPLLKEGDLLVTTGMDGVFPPLLRVANVIKVYPLKEGAYTYTIEAVPAVPNLNAIRYVSVIPPINFKKESS